MSSGRAAVLAIATLLVTACASTSVSIGTDAAAMRAANSAIRTQAQDAFRQANDGARAVAIEHRLNVTEPAQGRSPDLTLSEDDFPRAVTASDAAEWDRAFAELDGYFLALQSLVDPTRTRVTGEELTNVIARLNSEPVEAGLPDGFSAVFATLFENLVRAQAEREATAIMRRLDPQFGVLTTTLADAIGVDEDGGSLRGTVWVHWQARLDAYNVEYAQASTRTARRAIITSYLQAIDARDAQLRSLEQLRTSVLALGEAHSAAARGTRGDVMFWLERIEAARLDIERRRQTLGGGN